VEGKSSGALRAMLRVMNLTISKAFTSWRNAVRRNHPHPQTFNPEKTLSPEPSTLNPQPTTLNPKPQTLNSNP